MFERFIRLAEARSALRKKRFEQALRLAGDPLVRSHRRAGEIRDRALAGLLGRARERADRGGLSAALADVSRVLALQPEYDGARTLAEELRQKVGASEGAGQAAHGILRDARRLAEEGELDAADRLCSAAREMHATAAETAVQQVIAGRRAAAAELLKRAVAAERRGDLRGAIEDLRAARGRCRDLPGAGELGTRVAAARARELVAELRALHEAGDDATAHALLARERHALPELTEVKQLESFTKQAVASHAARLSAVLGRGDVDQAVEQYRDLDARLLDDPAWRPMREVMDDVCRALELRDRGDFRGAAECAARVQAVRGGRELAAFVADLEREGAASEAALEQARADAAAGRLVEARHRLTEVLERWPLHESVRHELQILDQGAKDRAQRLTDARRCAGEGRLREASAAALSLAVPGPPGEEARLLLKDVQARLDLVRSGLDQVRRAVHGRHSGSIEGLRHCVLRLDELAKVQTDSADISTLRNAIAAEIDGVRMIEAADAAVERGQAAQVVAQVAELPAVFERLLRPDRLDARALQLADRIAGHAETAMAAGRLTAARGWALALAPFAARYADVAERCSTLAQRETDRQEQAQRAVEEGIRALDGRDSSAAEAALREARDAWVDGAPVVRLEERLRHLRTQETVLEEVEELTAKRDYAAAHRCLGGLPPTPALLRTRIFDIKQGLARAQGLDGGFLLRVDEGGEFLVLRGDSISIGNVREGKADLAILANIAGRHATIQRSMSFHGGMQDRIRADKGDVRVAGRPVSEHRLQDGDRVRLGASLELSYRVPSKRSLTAGLTLSSGFQVAGTDKVLLMRDRGRDGRILIAATNDVHVRVPHEQDEIELFARKDGQMRVAFAGKGLLNGRPFSGEHPVAAGDVVTCGHVAFVLQPWSSAV